MVRRRHRAEVRQVPTTTLRSLRMMTLTMRRLGAGNPPLHRFRVGLEFALSGHREVDGMLAHHSALARSLGEQLGAADEVLDALGAAYERWDGHGWPGSSAARTVPLAARRRAAGRVRGGGAHASAAWTAASAARARRAGKQFDPRARASCLLASPRRSLRASSRWARWSAVIDAEPSLAVVLSGESFDAALRGDRELRGHQVPLHARPLARRRRSSRRSRRDPRAGRVRGAHAAAHRPRARLRTAGRVELDLGQAGSARRRRVGARADAPLPHRAHAHQSGSLAPLGQIAVQHRERLDGSGYPRGLSGRGDLPPRAHPRRRRRLSGDARAAAAPPRARARRRRRAAARRGEGGAPRRGGGRRRAGRGGPPRAAPARGSGRPHAARGRGAAAARPGPVEQGDRRAAGDLAQDRRQPRRAHLLEDRRLHPRGAGLFAMQHGLLPAEQFAASA